MPERFIAAELIREKILHETRQEVAQGLLRPLNSRRHQAGRDQRRLQQPQIVPREIEYFIQLGDVGVAGILKLRFGLSFGKTVATRDRGVGVVLARAVNRVVVRPRLRRWILR